MIHAEGLTKQFGEMLAVRDLSLTVQQGEILALLGPNGAGKTTTVRMLASIIKPTAGRATVAGFDIVAEAQQVRGAVGLLTEFPGLYKRMRAVEYLDFIGQLQRMPAARRRERIEFLLRQFGLWEARGIRLGNYSKGMAQKLALIRAMLHDPPVLFLDEPTSAMDPHSAKMVRDTIRWLREQGKAIMMCTHNLAEAQELADRIAIIRRGEMVALGALDELRGRHVGGTLCEVHLARPWDGLLTLMKSLVEVESYGDSWVRYRTSNIQETNPRVIHELAKAGASVVTVSIVANALEDVYLSMIRDMPAAQSSTTPEGMQ